MKDYGAVDALVAWYRPDTGGIGELHVVVSARGFGGTSSAWFNDSTVLDFAALLATYPLPRSHPSLSSGYGAVGNLEQEHIGLIVRPVGPRGQVSVQVHLAATPVDRRPEELREVRLELLTTYERLRRFSSDLTQVVRGQLAEARLEGETLIGY